MNDPIESLERANDHLLKRLAEIQKEKQQDDSEEIKYWIFKFLDSAIFEPQTQTFYLDTRKIHQDRKLSEIYSEYLRIKSL